MDAYVPFVQVLIRPLVPVQTVLVSAQYPVVAAAVHLRLHQPTIVIGDTCRAAPEARQPVAAHALEDPLFGPIVVLGHMEESVRRREDG